MTTSKYFNPKDEIVIDSDDEDIKIIGTKMSSSQKRPFESSDDEKPEKQLKTSLSDRMVLSVQYEKLDNNEDKAKIDFEKMCEDSIQELQKMFPQIDIFEIQDALIECDWSVFNASIQL